MEEFEFDRTRKKLQMNKLEADERKSLFNRFVRIGGRVVKEFSLKKKTTQISQGGEVIPPKLPSEIAREQAVERIAAQGRRLSRVKTQKQKTASFSARLGLRLRAKQAGIAGFSSKTVKPVFFSQMIHRLHSDHVNLKAFVHEFVIKNKEADGKLLLSLKAQNPIYVHLMRESVGIYRKEDAVVFKNESAIKENICFSSIKASVFAVIGRLHALKPFQKNYLQALRTAVGLMLQVSQEKEKIKTLIRETEKSWADLMNQVYPRLALLAQRIEMKPADPNSELFTKILGISTDGRPQ